MSTLFVSYAQNYEDLMLWKALHEVTDGFYIDIGAQDPQIDSVSFGFYERGWRGVHVEPVPNYADKLRLGRPDETVLQVAIGSGGPLLKFWAVPGSGWSTGDEELARGYAAQGIVLEQFHVPCLSLASVLDQYSQRDIHWLKIDVEGMEDRVIESWTPSKVRPWIIVVEATLPNSQIPSFESWEPKLQAFGYEFVYFDGLNRFYVSEKHAELKSAFSAPPNPFDNFALSGTAQNSTCSLLNQKIQNLTSLAESLQGSLAKSEGQLLETHAHVGHARAEVDELKEQIQRSTAEAEHFRNVLDERERTLHEWQEQFRIVSEESRRLLKDWLNTQTVLSKEVNTSKAEVERLTQLALERERQIREMHRTRASAARVARKNEQIIAHGEGLVRQLQLRVQEKENLEQQLRSQLTKMEETWSWKLTGLLRRAAIGSPVDVDAAPGEEQGKGVPAAVLEKGGPARINEILSENDSRFVEAAFVAVLKRRPDANGAGYYWNMLQMGASKIEILLALRRSGEGVQVNADVKGLNWRLQAYQVSQMRVFGWIIRLFLRAEVSVDPSSVRRLSDVLSLRGEAFVEEAYRVMLHRSADQEGLKTYVNALRSGKSKVHILRALRSSCEGRRIHPQLRGLSQAVAFENICRIPVVGRVLNAWVQSGAEVVWSESKQKWLPKSNSN
jgi:FkbM family methyltransferase